MLHRQNLKKLPEPACSITLSQDFLLRTNSGIDQHAGGSRSDIPVLPQPVCLRLEIPEDNVAFFVLKTPRHDDNGVAFPDPCPFLDFSLDPAHAGDTVNTPDADMISPEHLFGKGKLFIIPFFWQPDADGGRAVGIHCIQVRFFGVFFMKTTHSTNYVLVIYRAADMLKGCIGTCRETAGLLSKNMQFVVYEPEIPSMRSELYRKGRHRKWWYVLSDYTLLALRLDSLNGFDY